MTMSTPLSSISMLGLACALLLGCGEVPSVSAASRVPPARALGGEEAELLVLPAERRPYVETSVATMEPEHATIRAPARVAFRSGALSRVSSPIAGRVVKLHVEVGDKVKAGDPLVTIASPAASELQMELARARIEVSSEREQLARQEEMSRNGVGREYERVLAGHRVSEAEALLRHAKKAVSLLGKNANGVVVVAAAIDGTVLRRVTTLGAQVEPGGDPMIELGNPNALWVVAEVFQDDLPLVSTGAEVSLEFAAVQQETTGRVEGIGVLTDAGLRRAPVYVALTEPPVGLTPGMFARANIHTPSTTGVTVPRNAVLIKDGKTAVVYTEENPGEFRRREVVRGHTFGEYVQILSGLAAGERVAVQGALLIDGTAQRIL